MICDSHSSYIDTSRSEIMPLNYTNSIPLHFQLKKKIEERIFTEEYTDKIPSERELMDEFYVSRSTVRQSIAQLVHEGVLEKRHGRGTFIAVKPINDWLGNLSSTNETVERMGMKPGAKLLKSETVLLTDPLKKITGLDEAYHFKRLRFANQVPIGIENHYYPVHVGNKLIKYDLNKEAFYELLERELGVKTFEADQVIKSIAPTEVDAKLLHIPDSSHVLNAQRKITDIHGHFVEFENAFYRADMYSFHIKLSRKSN